MAYAPRGIRRAYSLPQSGPGAVKGSPVGSAAEVGDRLSAVAAQQRVDALAHRAIGHADQHENLPGFELLGKHQRVTLRDSLHHERSGRAGARRADEDLGERTGTEERPDVRLF